MKKERTHTLIGILSYRITPVDRQLKSPAVLLNNTKLRTTLPTAQRALLTGIDRDQVKESLYERQKQQAITTTAITTAGIRNFNARCK